MQIYLPIAEIPVNVFAILALGLFAGFLAGMFGIGGGFIATPLLMFIGIPSGIAVATSTNQIIASTQTEKKLGEKILKIAPAKMTVIPLTCTRPLFLSKEKAQKKLTQNEQKNTKEDYHIGTIANFYANKGIDILIRAAELVITQNPQVHLYVIGKGPEEKILRTMVALSPAHNNIHLLGAIPDAAQLLLAFDLFVLPSRKEGLPYALLEAMHAEIPIIATNVGGVAEVIQTYPRGVVVPPENKEILANAILGQLHHTAESQEPTHFLQTFPSITILEFYEQLLIGLRRS